MTTVLPKNKKIQIKETKEEDHSASIQYTPRQAKNHLGDNFNNNIINELKNMDSSLRKPQVNNMIKLRPQPVSTKFATSDPEEESSSPM